MSPSPKYVVLGWDYNDNEWKIVWYGTNRRQGEQQLRGADYGEVRLAELNVIATEEGKV